MKKPNEEYVATFNDVEKADAVKKELEAAGIRAEVYDETKLQKFWFLTKPLAAEKVVVDEKDFARAQEVLKSADVQYHVLQGEVRCPECGSANVEYPQFTRKFMTPTLVEVCCFLHILDKAFFCVNCQHTWPVKNMVEQETDIMNWPKGDKLAPKEKT